MGMDVFSMHVKGGNGQQIAKALRGAAEEEVAAFYTHAGAGPQGGWLSIYPSADTVEAIDLVELAQKFKAQHALLLWVHDSSVLMYFYLRGANLVDSFNSAPDYFGEADEFAMAAVGKPEKFADLVGEAGVARLRTLLAGRMINGEAVGGEVPDEETDRLKVIGEVFGLPAILTTFESLEAGERPTGLEVVDRIEMEAE